MESTWLTAASNSSRSSALKIADRNSASCRSGSRTSRHTCVSWMAAASKSLIVLNRALSLARAASLNISVIRMSKQIQCIVKCYRFKVTGERHQRCKPAGFGEPTNDADFGGVGKSRQRM